MKILIGGPDGCGKSTVAELLSDSLTSRGMVTERLHYRPNILFGTGAEPEVEGASDAPYGPAAHGLTRSVIKLLITYADELAHTVLRVTGRRPRVVIQERGWWDQAIDTRRYRLHRASGRLVEFLGAWLPRADLVVVLTGPSSVIHDRKPELPLEEIDRQLSEWRSGASRMARRHLFVDVRDTAPQNAVDGILQAMAVQ
jgi:hypothetical protein